jgi:CHAT domain
MAVITCASRSVQMLTTAALPLLDGYWIKTDWESVAEVIGESDDTFAKSGLARAFFFASAPSLLVSQWSVDDSATQNLMAGVLSGYAADPTLTRARALQLGMLRLMRQQAHGDHAYFAHPFSWAPFFIVGEGGSPKSQRGRVESSDSARFPVVGIR